MEDVEGNARSGLTQAPLREQKVVEARVESDEDEASRSSDARSSGSEPDYQRDTGGRAYAVAQPEIQRVRRRTFVEEEPDPGNSPPTEIRSDHARDRPAFEVLSLNRRIEHDQFPVDCEPHA